MTRRGPPTADTHGAFSMISHVVCADTPASTMLPTSPADNTERPSPSRSSARSRQPAFSSVCFAFASGPGRRSAPMTFGYLPEAASTAVSLPWSQPMSATGCPGRTSSAAAVRRASSVGHIQNVANDGIAGHLLGCGVCLFFEHIENIKHDSFSFLFWVRYSITYCSSILYPKPGQFCKSLGEIRLA